MTGNVNQRSSRVGKAVELLIAAFCVLTSKGRLNVSTTVVDDEGVDLTFHVTGMSATLSAQVKSRTTEAKTVSRGTFRATVRSQTFRPRRDFFALFVVVSLQDGQIERAWLVPSEELANRAKQDTLKRYKFAAAMSAKSKDQWHKFKVAPPELHTRISEILATFSQMDLT